MIEACGLTKQYGTVKALDNVSFTLHSGTICGIIGHNGAGKTTLLKILAGLVSPSSGQLKMNGIPIEEDPVGIKTLIGYLPEESRLYENMTVVQYLTFFGELYGLTKKEILERGDRLLSSLSLDHEGKQIGNLSKGMKRKVAIARSLIHDPSILIYDEATSGLDPMTSRFITDYMIELKKAGKTIVLSAHNLFQVERICDIVIMLRQGVIVNSGSMEELRELFGSLTYDVFISHMSEKPGFPATPLSNGLYRVTVSSVNELNRVTTSVTQEGGTVERIESVYPTLEEMLVRVGK